jgi:NAD(P)-dependent dehydrogenase (short-subunit alcohol dehydrogenase family)
MNDTSAIFIGQMQSSQARNRCAGCSQPGDAAMTLPPRDFMETNMQTQKTIVITGASQGIGAGLVRTFLQRGYNVVATSRSVSASSEFAASTQLARVDGDIGDHGTAQRVVATAIEKFGSIDALVNNAGIFFTKPFLDYTMEDFKRLSSTNLEGFIHLTQLAVKQMLAQKTGGSIVSITTPLADHPIAGINASVPMMTKGGIDAISKNLAMEYSKDGIRVNTVAPGVVDTPLHKDNPKDFLKTLSPMGRISSAEEIVDAVVFLTEAHGITGEVLHVDNGAHLGRW